MTERELAMPLWRDKEDTGLVLTLSLTDRPPAAVARTAWLRNDRLLPLEHAWLDAAKLRELGVEVAVTPPSGTSTTVTFTATAMNAPTGVTYQLTAEGDANAARGTASGNTLNYDESCAGC